MKGIAGTVPTVFFVRDVRACPGRMTHPGQSKPAAVAVRGSLSGMSGVISIALRDARTHEGVFVSNSLHCKNGLGYSFFLGHLGQRKEVIEIESKNVSEQGYLPRTLPGHPGQRGL